MKTTNSSAGFIWIQLKQFYVNKTYNDHRELNLQRARLKVLSLHLVKLKPQLRYWLLAAATICQRWSAFLYFRLNYRTIEGSYFAQLISFGSP